MLEKLSVGDVIEFTEKEKKILELKVDDLKTAHVAFDAAATGLKRAREGLWDTVDEIYPGLKDRYDLNINHDRLELSVVRKK